MTGRKGPLGRRLEYRYTICPRTTAVDGLAFDSIPRGIIPGRSM